MTVLEMIKELEASEDVTVFKGIKDGKPEYHVTIMDFEGFDEDFDEVLRDCVKIDLLEELVKTLEKECVWRLHDLYTTYYFKDLSIKIGYESYDI